jgi:hypothetical protein
VHLLISLVAISGMGYSAYLFLDDKQNMVSCIILTAIAFYWTAVYIWCERSIIEEPPSAIPNHWN